DFGSSLSSRVQTVILTFCFASSSLYAFFFFKGTASTAAYTLSLHDALPILLVDRQWRSGQVQDLDRFGDDFQAAELDLCGVDDTDRKSTRLNSSHVSISYAVFCLKKKNKQIKKNLKSNQENKLNQFNTGLRF